ncbi:hypothetical protein [Microvirga zambiensis]|jgi:hypothetical protein|uniref:hypothetical protein n=1 Tax=Microvirga zambiensis TaxID=1402137 RepID=UPI00191DFA85|nr:hypothetical protein [Microvirga zambiensis]
MSSTTHVIEVGEVTAGIVVSTEGGFRFFAAGLAFKSLDLAIFASIEEASRAARAKFIRRRH